MADLRSSTTASWPRPSVKTEAEREAAAAAEAALEAKVAELDRSSTPRKRRSRRPPAARQRSSSSSARRRESTADARGCRAIEKATTPAARRCRHGGASRSCAAGRRDREDLPGQPAREGTASYRSSCCGAAGTSTGDGRPSCRRRSSPSTGVPASGSSAPGRNLIADSGLSPTSTWFWRSSRLSMPSSLSMSSRMSSTRRVALAARVARHAIEDVVDAARQRSG